MPVRTFVYDWNHRALVVKTAGKLVLVVSCIHPCQRSLYKVAKPGPIDACDFQNRTSSYLRRIAHLLTRGELLGFLLVTMCIFLKHRYSHEQEDVPVLKSAGAQEVRL